MGSGPVVSIYAKIFIGWPLESIECSQGVKAAVAAVMRCWCGMQEKKGREVFLKKKRVFLKVSCLHFFFFFQNKFR